MTKPFDTITAGQLMKRWTAEPFDIYMAINDGLPYYRKNAHGIFNAKDMMALDFNDDEFKDERAATDTRPIPDYFFKLSDVETFEVENPGRRGGQRLDKDGHARLMRLARQEPHLIAVAAAAMQ